MRQKAHAPGVQHAGRQQAPAASMQHSMEIRGGAAKTASRLPTDRVAPAGRVEDQIVGNEVVGGWQVAGGVVP